MSPLRQVKCLVVEPQMGLRNLLDDLLSVSNCEVVAVAAESEALKMLREPECDFEVVFCPAPPVGAKHSLVSKIRSNKSDLGKMPVICLSPANGLQERAMAYESGASEYMLLPVSPLHLEERAHYWAGREHRPY